MNRVKKLVVLDTITNLSRLNVYTEYYLCLVAELSELLVILLEYTFKCRVRPSTCQLLETWCRTWRMDLSKDARRLSRGEAGTSTWQVAAVRLTLYSPTT